MINPSNPVYNAIIFYIIIVVLLLLLKPNIMYCKDKNKFKTFGLSGEDKTLLSFPVICIVTVILLYLFFVIIKIVNNYLEEKN